VEGKVTADFEDRGEQQVKNITRSVRVYAVRAAAAPATSPRAIASDHSKPLPLPDKPSIAVLPFQNIGGDPEQEYFADGVVEDIIVALSRFNSLFVIARNSSFTYKGRAVDVKQVGRELGVRYVLNGSVRKAGAQLRITGQLIEAATGRHVWGDKFDGPLEDVFELQDQITNSVVGSIAWNVNQVEIDRARQKPANALESYDLYLRGLPFMDKRKPFPEAYSFFRQAFEKDPEYGAAYAMAAFALMMQQYVSGAPIAPDLQREAIDLADLGARASSADAVTLARAGHVLAYFGQFERGATMIEEAVNLNPNLAVAWQARGWVSIMCDEQDRAIDSFQRFMRLVPTDKVAWCGVAFAQFFMAQYEEGCASASKASAFHSNTLTLVPFIANALLAGRETDAHAAGLKLTRLHPEFRVSQLNSVMPSRFPANIEQVSSALRLAGLPD
jgi:TolB-like protein